MNNFCNTKFIYLVRKLLLQIVFYIFQHLVGLTNPRPGTAVSPTQEWCPRNSRYGVIAQKLACYRTLTIETSKYGT